MSKLLPLIFLLLFVSSLTSTFASPDEVFLRCVLNVSDPAHPISSEIFTPQSTNYSSVLQSYIRNLRYNTSSTPKPLFIITASHESHVQAAVICGKRRGLQMKIRSGGHDYDGLSYVSKAPFFVLDMFKIRSILVDISTETAFVQAGATLGELYYAVANRSLVHGFSSGVCPSLGAGGHFSGGGYGNMMRKYGLSVDNIVDAQIVDANGRLLDRKSMGEDLFWAIRGGGGASFGVIVSYTIKLVQVQPKVTVFKVEKSLEQNVTDLVLKWQEVAPKIDRDLFLRLILRVANGTKSGKKTVSAAFISMFLGNTSRLVNLMSTSFPELGLKSSDCHEITWLESVLFWLDLPIGTPTDVLLSRTPKFNIFLKRKSDYVQTPIPRDGLEKLWSKMIELETPSLQFNPYGGKMEEIDSMATPFPHRAGILWKIQYSTNWVDGALSNQNVDLTRKLYEFMTPYVSKNPRQAFLNYRDVDIGINHYGKNAYAEGLVYGRAYFNNNFDRLVKIKTEVDPDNFFRNEQSIPVDLPPRM